MRAEISADVTGRTTQVHYRKRLKRTAVVFGSVIAALGALGYVLQLELTQVMQRNRSDALVALRDAAASGAHTWFDAQKRAARTFVATPSVRDAFASHVRAYLDDDAGGTSAPLGVTEWLESHGGDARFKGMALITQAGTVVEQVGLGLRADSPLPPAFRSLVDEAVADAVPVRAVEAIDADAAHMVAAVRIDAQRPELGLVLLGLDGSGLAEVLQAARPGASGETYVFDQKARLVSESRFVPQLRGARLIGADDESAILALEIRDPGGDLMSGYQAQTVRREQPLTLAAEAALAGKTGTNVEGYRDYRGVQVIGAWTFLPSYGLGLVTEQDFVDAYAPMGTVRHLFVALVLTAMVLAVLALVISVARERSMRATHKAERAVAKLGQYRLEKKLGEGGMGAVYRGSHALLRRPTAIKVIRAGYASGNAQARFEREVQRTAELSHPNTIAIYDYGKTDEGLFFYAMEYLEGLDLDEAVERFGPMLDARVSVLLSQAASALGEAHSKGMVHRDVKPGNLFLCERGGLFDFVKVLDFGLVKAASDASMTSDGMVVGTPYYMAPEMTRSATSACPQSDVYALGAVGYYLLTGEQVFDRESVTEVCLAHLEDEPVPPSQRRGQPVDPQLEEIIMQCLRKDPLERPSNGRQLADMLEGCSVRSGWTAKDAKAWWEAYGERIAAAHATQAESVDTGMRAIRETTDQLAGHRTTSSLDELVG